MSSFKLELQLGNDAMNGVCDIVRALRGVADRLQSNQYPLDESITRGIRDENGNHVGAWNIEADDAVAQDDDVVIHWRNSPI